MNKFQKVVMIVLLIVVIGSASGCNLRGSCEHLDCPPVGAVQSGLQEAIEAGEAAVEGAQRWGEASCQWDMIECPAEYED